MTAPIVNSRQESSPEQLRAEARALGRFILKREIDQEFIDRYVEAHNYLFIGPQPPRELALVRTAVGLPWLLPALEAAAAFRTPDSMLHKKSLLMSAILEASPRYADDFLPRRCGWFGLLLLGTRLGFSTALALAVGLPSMFLLRRRP